MVAALVASLVIGLAGHRITRLVVMDSFPFAPFRKWLVREAPQKIEELFTCPWCFSGWVTLALTAIVAQFESVPVPGLVWFASWSVAVTAYHAAEALAGEVHEDD